MWHFSGIVLGNARFEVGSNADIEVFAIWRLKNVNVFHKAERKPAYVAAQLRRGSLRSSISGSLTEVCRKYNSAKRGA